MRELLSMSVAPAGGAAPASDRITLVQPWHPARLRVEGFIEDRFRASFGARLQGPYPALACCLDDHGEPLAAAAVRFAETEPLFLERYLDQPVEQAAARSLGHPVARESIVEIGSFAAVDVRSALTLFTGLAAWLAGPCRRRYAVATARPELGRLLRRAGYDLHLMSEADAARLGDRAEDWGSYYDAGPRVFVGEIGSSPRRLRIPGGAARDADRAELRGTP